MKLIGHGAEAKIFLFKFKKNSKISLDKKNILDYNTLKEYLELDKNYILKYRYSKKYRHPILDLKLIKQRTRREYKILSKLSESISPIPYYCNEKLGILIMGYIEGLKLSETFEKENYLYLASIIGKKLAIIHNKYIAHGDLTTSNMILTEDKDLIFIDFGLSYFTKRFEDFAVDLHLLKEAIQSKHYIIYPKIWPIILNTYLEHINWPKEIYSQFLKVEKRGRYKTKKLKN